MEPIFTILNHGTDSHRSRTDGEIIADFGRNMQGSEYDDFLITDGPGSSGTKSDRMPGKFDPFTQDKVPTGVISRLTGKSPGWSTSPHTKTIADITAKDTRFFNASGDFGLGAHLTPGIKGIARGQGWDDNIRHAIAAIVERQNRKNLGTMYGTINMIGWSRGAVTCLRMANWIKEFLGDNIKINIFAIDPVAGLDAGEKLKDTYTIPDIVQDYIAVLALDEKRGAFAPQDQSRIHVDSFKTNVAFLTFPGVHNTLVRSNDKKAPEVGVLVRSLAYKFLKDHGTLFNQPEKLYNTLQVCELYADMKAKRNDYRKMMSQGIIASLQGGLETRSICVADDKMRKEGNSNSFFVNEHHRECFKIAFRDVYSYFFTRDVPNPLGKVTTAYRASDPWGQKFQQFYQSAPKSFEALSTVYPLERQGGFGAPAIWKVAAPGIGVPKEIPPFSWIIQSLIK